MSPTEMAAEIRIRRLEPSELSHIAEIDRTELVVSAYEIRGGALDLQTVEWDIGRWSEERIREYVQRFSVTLDRGGSGFCAEAGDSFIGVAVLSAHPIASDASLRELEFLHVSAPYRGHGIGRRLFDAVVEPVVREDAGGLYITATPSDPTVDFYLARGARVAEHPDPQRLIEEPDDVHLILRWDEKVV